MEKNDSHWEALVFVYNADTGIFSVVSDFAHKIIAPETYACNLCKLTYGNFATRKLFTPPKAGFVVSSLLYGFP